MQNKDKSQITGFYMYVRITFTQMYWLMSERISFAYNERLEFPVPSFMYKSFTFKAYITTPFAFA